MGSGEQEVYEAENQIVLNVGDAGLFEFSINQEPGRSLGESGQVVTVEIDIVIADNLSAHKGIVLMNRKAISGRDILLTALLLGHICPIYSFVASCQPSAPLQTSLNDS